MKTDEEYRNEATEFAETAYLHIQNGNQPMADHCMNLANLYAQLALSAPKEAQ